MGIFYVKVNGVFRLFFCQKYADIIFIKNKLKNCDNYSLKYRYFGKKKLTFKKNNRKLYCYL